MRAEIDLQGLEHVVRVDPEHFGADAVDIGIDLRRARVEGGEHIGEAGLLRGGRHDIRRHRFELRGSPPPTSCTSILKPPVVPMPRTGGGETLTTKASWMAANFVFSASSKASAL